jgi:Domain of Unknown Function (DUF930)
MLREIVAALAVVLLVPGMAAAGSIEDALAKLDPEERSHQACILRGMDAVRRDPLLAKADRMKTSIFGPAVLKGTLLTARGGAVRAGTRWYALSFTCQLTPDLMKATSFAFTVGAEIPQKAWERLGLWG